MHDVVSATVASVRCHVEAPRLVEEAQRGAFTDATGAKMSSWSFAGAKTSWTTDLSRPLTMIDGLSAPDRAQAPIDLAQRADP
jgi:hypothetical protein